jgi:hypothetical protein
MGSGKKSICCTKRQSDIKGRIILSRILVERGESVSSERRNLHPEGRPGVYYGPCREFCSVPVRIGKRENEERNGKLMMS